MTQLESIVCQMVEPLKSNEIESLISELQMISESKYTQEEETRYALEKTFGDIPSQLSKLTIFA